MVTAIVILESGAISVRIPFISSDGYTLYKAFETYPEAKEIVLL